MRFPVEIVRRMREACGPDFIIIYRLSMLDLVDGGQSWDEVVALAKAVEAAGATIINTGIGWHEARIPTIATSVPRARLRLGHRAAEAASVGMPLITTNRINTPEVAERILAAATPTWCRWRGRCWPIRTSSTRRATAAPTRSTPASPATRPASTTCSRTRSPPAWSIRAPATRPSSTTRATAAPQAHRRGRRRPGRAWPARPSPPSAATA